MNEHPVLYAEEASDLRGDVSKIGLVLCAFIPLSSIVASFFFSTYAALTDSSSTEEFMKSNFYYVYMLFLSIIPIGACILILSLLFKRKPSIYMLKPTVNMKNFSLLTVLGLISIPLGSIISAVTANIMTDLGLKLSETKAPIGFFPSIFFIISHVFLAPVLEEILFRGIILERLRRYSDIFAAVVSAFLFSIMHSSLQSIPFAFASGLFFSFLAIYTGSPLASMIVHFINNALSVLSIFLLKHGLEKELPLIIYAIFAIIVFSSLIILISNRQNLFDVPLNKGILKASRKASILFCSFTITLFLIMSIGLAIYAVI